MDILSEIAHSYIEFLKEIINKQDNVIEMLRSDLDDLKNENPSYVKQDELLKCQEEKKVWETRCIELSNLLDSSNKGNEMFIRLNRVEAENEKLLYVIGGVYHDGRKKDACVLDRYNEGMSRLDKIGLSIRDLEF